MKADKTTQVRFTAELLLKNIPEQLILEHLPVSLRDLLDLIPLSDVLVLIEKYGGHYIIFSSGSSNSSNAVLKKYLSQDSVRKLSEKYSGDRLIVAKAQKLRCLFRDQQIIQLHKKGVTVEKLVHQFDLSERCIYKIFQRHRSTLKEKAL